MLLNRATVVLVLGLLCVGGCGQRTRLASPNAWPFWPQRMRIHPLSRLVIDQDSGPAAIMARIEFLDMHGHTSKGVGRIRIDLHPAGSPSRSREPIKSWFEDLRDLPLNKVHYDDVTRTYLLRLEIDPEVLPDQPQLRAYFLSTDGQRLEATYRLPR